MATFKSSVRSKISKERSTSSAKQAPGNNYSIRHGLMNFSLPPILFVLLSVSLAGNYLSISDNLALEQAHNSEILRADSLLSAKLHIEKQLLHIQHLHNQARKHHKDSISTKIYH